jgi:anti-sigma factor RsiW
MIRTLTCRVVVAVLMDYVDGTLAASTRRGVEDHLKTCAPCRDFERAYRATPGVVRRATGVRPSKESSLRQLWARALKRQAPRS